MSCFLYTQAVVGSALNKDISVAFSRYTSGGWECLKQGHFCRVFLIHKPWLGVHGTKAFLTCFLDTQELVGSAWNKDISVVFV